MTPTELDLDIETFIPEPLSAGSLLLEISPLQHSSLSSILEICATTSTMAFLQVDVVGATDVYDTLLFDGVTCLAPHVNDLTLRVDSCSLGSQRVLERSFKVSFYREAFLRMVRSRWGLLRDRGDGARMRSLTLCAPSSSRPSEMLKTLAELEEEGLAVEFYGYSWVVHFEPELGTEI